MLRCFNVWREERGVEDRMDACIFPCLGDAQLVRDRSQLVDDSEGAKSLSVELGLRSLRLQVSAFEPDAISNLMSGRGSTRVILVLHPICGQGKRGACFVASIVECFESYFHVRPRCVWRNAWKRSRSEPVEQVKRGASCADSDLRVMHKLSEGEPLNPVVLSIITKRAKVLF
jgi:hypothetical protein